MADPKHNYNEEKPKGTYPCYAGQLFAMDIYEDTIDNQIGVFNFCSIKHELNANNFSFKAHIEKHNCRLCRKEATQFKNQIHIDKTKTELTREFIQKFIYFKIEKRDWHFVVSQEDKDYLNRPEVTLEYLMRPEVERNPETEFTDEVIF